MYYKYNLHQLLHLSENKNSVIAKDNSFRRLFSVWKMNKYYMEIECLYLIVAHRKWPPLSPAVCRFSFLSSLLLFFSLLLLPLVFQHHSFHPRIKQRGLHSITIANRTHPFLCVLLSGLMYLFLSHTCPLSYSVRLRMCRYTHDARSLASVSTITLFFLFFFFFPSFFNTFLLNQDNKLFLSLWFDTHNDYEFLFRISFFASLYLRLSVLFCDLLFSISNVSSF